MRRNRVDPLGNAFGPNLLGSLGFSSRCIQHHFTLTSSQVSYGLKVSQIRLSDYRNGDSAIAHQVLNCIGHAQPINVEKVADQLRGELRVKITKNKKKTYKKIGKNTS